MHIKNVLILFYFNLIETYSIQLNM